MTSDQVLVVRIYLTEGAALDRLLRYLHDDSAVRGVTVFRGIVGFGQSGRVHTAKLIDSALDLPVVVEFFDQPARAREVLDHVRTIVAPWHVISWPVQVES